MKLHFFDIISLISHIPHSTQLPFNVIKVLQTVQALQYLSILLPNEGWGIWNYEDVYFQMLSNISSFFTSIPLIKDSQLGSFALFLSLTLIVFMLSNIIMIIIFGYNFQIQSNKVYSFLYITYYFMIGCNFVLQIPLLYLFCSQIFCGLNSFNSECTISFTMIINIFGLILLSCFTLFGQYFLRSYTFIQFNRLQSKFDLSQPIIYLLNIVTISLSTIEENQYLSYFKLIVLHLQFLLLLRQSGFCAPYAPALNKHGFTIYLILESILFIITFNILSVNSIFEEKNILVFILIVGSFAWTLSTPIFDQIKMYQIQYVDLTYVISYTQELYDQYMRTKESSKRSEFFWLRFYVESHLVVCERSRLMYQEKDRSELSKCKQLIFCVLSTQIAKAKQMKSLNQEDILLFYISYLCTFCKKPLVGFAELKKYEIMSEQQTFFFKKTRIQINLYLQSQILKQQNKNKIIMIGQLQEKQLEISDILNAFNLQQRYLPKFVEILDKKQNLLKEQIKGFNSIYNFEKLGTKLSQQIISLRNQLQQEISLNLENLEHIPLNTNVVEIKIAAIYFSSIVNDYYSTSICENTISEISTLEHTLAEEVITNLKLIDDKVALIMLSMVKNRGSIINPNKSTLAKYFEYTNDEFQQIYMIDQLMPHFVADIHDQLLVNYLNTLKSSFFSRYDPIFSLSKDGFLISQQLKIDNNFQYFDDYVLLGSMSQINSGSDYILFNDFGKIMGMTKNIYSVLIENQDQQFSINRVITQFYIYLFLPQLHSIIQEFRERNKVDYQRIHLSDLTSIWTYQNIKDVLSFYQNQNIQIPGRSHCQSHQDRYSSINSFNKKISEQDQSNIQDTLNQVYSQLNDVSQIQTETGKKKQKETNSFDSFALCNEQFMQIINQLIFELEQFNPIKYNAKHCLNFVRYGQGSYEKKIFILELQDLRKKELVTQTDSFNFNTLSASLKNNIEQSNEESHMVESPSDEPPDAEVTPNQLINQFDYQNVSKRYQANPNQNQSQTHKQILLLGLDSNRESISYGPLSQRANFINPASKQLNLDELLDQEINNLSKQLDISKIGFDCSKVMDQQMDNEQQEQSQNMKDSSSAHQQEISNKLLTLMRQNQKQKGLHNEEEEFGAQKSRSSATSGTSGVSAIQIIKKFQSKTQMIQNLNYITIINIFVGLILLSYTIIHVLIIVSNNDQTKETISDINGPMLFNRYFCKLFSYSWALVYNALKIVDSSDFMINTFLRQMNEMLATIFDDFSQMYPTFINVEQRGLMKMINLDLLYQPSEEVTYTYFNNFIQNTAKELFTATDYNLSTINSLITKTYTDNLLLLRYNLKNVVTLTTELIESINILFFSQLDSRMSSMYIQISIEIVVCAIIFFSQILFWNKIESYVQQILLLSTRFNETQAGELITRIEFIKDTLQQNSGKFSWKKQNFYFLGYQPVHLLGVDKISTNSKYSKKDLSKSQKKKNMNVVLNSRIYNTQTSIWIAVSIIFITFLFFLMFILGGYLVVNQQSVELQPSQQLIMNYIKFSTQFDILIACALIIKTQNLVYSSFIKQNVYTQEDIDNFRDQRAIIKIFIPIINTYNSNLSEIYSNILNSKKISDNHKQILFQLYEDNYCDSVASKIRFCNFNSTFVQDYGQYGPFDDNREFLSQGIRGCVSRVDTLINQIFQYEISNGDYDPDKSVLLSQVNTKEFTNAIIQHFIDTNDGTSYFLDIISLSISEIMQNDLDNVFIYYIAFCICLELLYFIVYCTFIYKTNQRLIFVRMILVNLPIEILTEQHTLSLIKRLD